MRALEVVVVGASRGGRDALGRLLGSLPGDFCLPTAIAYHRAAGSGPSVLSALGRRSLLPLCEAEDKQAIEPGRVYLAPADYHLLLEDGYFALSTEGPVQHARPSVDVLFESAAGVYGRRTVGVILTGTGRDGSAGLARIGLAGGLAVVQEPTTSRAADMPAAALDATPGARVLALEEIAPFLAAQAGRPRECL